MRYRFVDEIVSLALDGLPRIEVAKRFDPGDDVFGGPQGPERVPDSMLLELMAMTGGQLIFRHLGGARLPLLLKVPECRFDATASAGDRLCAAATLRGLTPVADGTSVGETDAEVYLEGAPIARARLMFVCVEPPAVGSPSAKPPGVEPPDVGPMTGPSA
jgi:3-hydroxymyristoyl/3-hydroxydecanoyl-(acyl carrier protein) dehydratase